MLRRTFMQLTAAVASWFAVEPPPPRMPDADKIGYTERPFLLIAGPCALLCRVAFLEYRDRRGWSLKLCDVVGARQLFAQFLLEFGDVTTARSRRAELHLPNGSILPLECPVLISTSSILEASPYGVLLADSLQMMGSNACPQTDV